MTKEELSTKEKILNVAHTLFSEKGFAAVGIREIAKLADVNVAAINYHFGNKEALHKATIFDCMSKMKEELSELYDGKMDAVELSGRYYDHLINNKEDVITSFKLFLNTDGAPYDVEDDDKTIGPPGGSVVYDCIKKDIPNASEDDLLWAVRVIFTQIIHGSLLICNHSESLCQNTGMDDKAMRESILRTVSVVLKEITP